MISIEILGPSAQLRTFSMLPVELQTDKYSEKCGGYGVSLNPKTITTFCLSRLMLGYCLCQRDTFQSSKILAVVQFMKPDNLSEIQSFLEISQSNQNLFKTLPRLLN